MDDNGMIIESGVLKGIGSGTSVLLLRRDCKNPPNFKPGNPSLFWIVKEFQKCLKQNLSMICNSLHLYIYKIEAKKVLGNATTSRVLVL